MKPCKTYPELRSRLANKLDLHILSEKVTKYTTTSEVIVEFGTKPGGVPLVLYRITCHCYRGQWRPGIVESLSLSDLLKMADTL